MAIYTVTTANWNDPAFWSAISEAGSGHELDFSGLPTGYSVDFDPATGRIILSDGGTNFTVGEAGYGGASDATLGGSTLLDFFTRLSGSQGDDNLRGSAAADTISGGGGNDTITGGGGSDSLDGGSGDDRFIVEDGFDNDTILGGTGTDHVDLSAVTGGVTVDFTAPEDGTITGGVDTISFDGVESLTLTSSSDFLTAGADTGGHYAEGLGGSDTLWGGLGDDTYSGGSGGDEIYGDAGNDLIYGDSGNDDLGGDDGNDTVSGGSGDDYAQGGAGNDIVYGGLGVDTLLGDGGDDTLVGGDGNDRLTGGAGNDTYVFESGGDNDTITDFDIGDSDADGVYNDQLDVSLLTNGSGGPVKLGDVIVVDDGLGNAKLLFPEGESVVLLGVTPAQMSTKAQKVAAGIPCFASGTMIRTARGDVPVERLRAGDLVQTKDNGLQPVLWSTMRAVRAAELADRRALRPVRLKAGTFGQERDLILSPQHGVLLRVDGDERLVRPAQLVRQGFAGVEVIETCRAVIYVHLFFAAHQIVFANGVPSESYYPGPMALAALADPALHELLSLFPDLGDVQALEDTARRYGAAARPYVRRRDLQSRRFPLSPPP